MTEKVKYQNSWIPIILIGAVVAAGAIVTTFKKRSVSEYVNESGNIVVPGDSAFSNWFGKEAPDFTVMDINGKKHSLSDYRGKNVMVIFWATWCPPCNAEIPHLIELRKEMGEDQLAMVAISTDEDADVVKNFVKTKNINYTVAHLGNSYIPVPFAYVNSIPTSFFINPDGRIKTVVVQSLNLEQIKAILAAKAAEEPKTTINDSNDS